MLKPLAIDQAKILFSLLPALRFYRTAVCGSNRFGRRSGYPAVDTCLVFDDFAGLSICHLSRPLQKGTCFFLPPGIFRFITLDFVIHHKFDAKHHFKLDMNGLLVDSLLKSFGTKVVLTDIWLQCLPGEIIGLLGRNGCGKSTLLKIIFGSMRADQQFVKADGKQLLRQTDRMNLISYLPQDGFLPPYIRVKTALKLFLQADSRQTVSAFPDLIPLLQTRAGNLSHGERRLLEIILVLHHPGRYALLDEPFNGLSPIQKEKVTGLIRSAAEQKGIIITDHDYRQVKSVASRLLLMHDGGLRQIKSDEELKGGFYLS